MKKFWFLGIVTMSLIVFAFSSCSSENNNGEEAPKDEIVISKVSSLFFEVLDELTIDGDFFAVSGNVVELENESGTYKLTILGETAKSIKTSIPNDVKGGVYKLKLTANGLIKKHSENIEIVELSLGHQDARIKARGSDYEIGGSFLPNKTKVFLNELELKIISQSSTKIIVELPKDSEVDFYNLIVKTPTQTIEDIIFVCSSYYEVVIVKTNKKQFVQNFDELILYGMNYAVGETTITFEGDKQKLSAPIEASEQGVTAKIKLPNLPVGKYKIYVEVEKKPNWSAEKISNVVEIEIIENPNPTPTITGVSTTTPTSGELITITGTNFYDIDNTKVILYVEYNGEDIMDGYITPAEITSTSLKFGVNRTSNEKVKVKVESKGKRSEFSPLMTFK